MSHCIDIDSDMMPVYQGGTKDFFKWRITIALGSRYLPYPPAMVPAARYYDPRPRTLTNAPKLATSHMYDALDYDLEMGIDLTDRESHFAATFNWGDDDHTVSLNNDSYVEAVRKQANLWP